MKEILQTIISAIEDKKGIDIKIIDIQSICSFADYFVIAEGNNRNQIQAIADNIEKELACTGIHPMQTEGYDSAAWILMDYRDIVIHIFDHESRCFYDLERIWRDGKSVTINDII